MQTSELIHSYKGKKIFLTGHTGFKGSWMLCWLKELGAEVMGYALAAETNGLYESINGDKLCTSVIADIRDRNKLSQSLIGFAPDIVFHFAAQPLVRVSYDQPAETFEVNVAGTANLLEAVRLYGKTCRVVIITTDKVYENKEWAYPYRETDRLGGHDPYSASKACAELVVDAYRKSFFEATPEKGISVVTARAGNVIGGGDWSKDRIIPDIIRSLQAGLPVPVRNPAAIRPWQHVLEPLAGYLELGIIDNGEVNRQTSFNLGPYEWDVLPVQELVDIAIKEWGSGSAQLSEKPGAPHEAGILKLDISKTVSLLKWRPVLKAREAIAWTIDWYRKAEKQTDKHSLVKAQINQYINRR